MSQRNPEVARIMRNVVSLLENGMFPGHTSPAIPEAISLCAQIAADNMPPVTLAPDGTKEAEALNTVVGAAVANAAADLKAVP